MRHREMLLQSRTRRGVSLVELMVAVAVGLFLIGGVIQIYLSSKQSYNTQEQLARMQENGRFAMDLVTTDLRRAGYWGGLTLDPDSDLGDPGAAAPSNTCPNGNNNWGRMVAWPVSALNDTATGFNCIPGSGAGAWLRGDVLTVRYPAYSPEGSLEEDRLYLRTMSELGLSATDDEKEARLGARIITGRTAADGSNELEAGAEVPIDRELVSRAYYVAQSGTTCSATGGNVPALWRVQLGDNGAPGAATEIAPGVEQLQLRFLDDSGVYVDADAVTDWASVRAVRFWLLMRGHCLEAGLNNNAEYNMGDQSYQPNDNFPRQLYISTVQLRNR